MRVIIYVFAFPGRMKYNGKSSHKIFAHIEIGCGFLAPAVNLFRTVLGPVEATLDAFHPHHGRRYISIAWDRLTCHTKHNWTWLFPQTYKNYQWGPSGLVLRHWEVSRFCRVVSPCKYCQRWTHLKKHTMKFALSNLHSVREWHHLFGSSLASGLAWLPGWPPSKGRLRLNWAKGRFWSKKVTKK